MVATSAYQPDCAERLDPRLRLPFHYPDSINLPTWEQDSKVNILPLLLLILGGLMPTTSYISVRSTNRLQTPCVFPTI